MTDSELLSFTQSFRDGILDGRSSRDMCAAVSWPLATLLGLHGVECEPVEGDISEPLGLLYANHMWIALKCGRVLDATADQFNVWGYDFQQVYLGEPTEIHPSRPQDRP